MRDRAATLLVDAQLVLAFFSGAVASVISLYSPPFSRRLHSASAVRTAFHGWAD